MAIRRSLFLSFAAAAVAVGGAASSAVAQQGHSPLSPPPHQEVTDGLILSADDIVLGPGETLLDGGPGVAVAPAAPPGHPGHLPGHQPMFPPGSEMAIGMPCPTCEPGHYVSAEALYFTHSEERGFINDDALVFTDEFDQEWAGRLTLGRRFDCVNGYEIVYTGPLEWEMGLDATYDIGGGAGGGGTTTTISQDFEARLNSVELNRTYFGWDVVKATHGIRVMLYEEASSFSRTTAPAPPAFRDDGILAESIDNILIGPQAGLELYYPLSNRFFVGGKLKGGVYANFFESDMRVDGDFASDDDVDIAGMFELGTNVGFRVTDAITATAGYELWYLAGIAGSYDVIPDRFVFREPSANDEVFMHGFTAGVHVAF